MFVAGLGSGAADDAIVAATIDMAHALGMVHRRRGGRDRGAAPAARRARLRPRAGVPPRRARCDGRPPPAPRAPPRLRPAPSTRRRRSAGHTGDSRVPICSEECASWDCIDKVKETAQKGADATKGAVKRGPGQDRRHEDQEEDQGAQGRARRPRLRAEDRAARPTTRRARSTRIVAEIKEAEVELAASDAADDRTRFGVRCPPRRRVSTPELGLEGGERGGRGEEVGGERAVAVDLDARGRPDRCGRRPAGTTRRRRRRASRRPSARARHRPSRRASRRRRRP